MKKRWLGILLALCLLVCFAPAALAVETDSPADPIKVYVDGEQGDDTDGDGSLESPYATLAKAAEYINNQEEIGGTYNIYVMSNLTSTACARFYDCHVTISSYDDPETEDVETYKVTRGDSFQGQHEAGRNWYNPSLLEIGKAKYDNDGSFAMKELASLTLENITFDDAGETEGKYYLQAGIEGLPAGATSGNIVQDAIIATYSNTSEITLGAGAVLKNYGGMSAVHLADGTLTMESGSKIIDDSVTDRTKGESGSVGPAGAVWMQGGTFTMEEGAVVGSENSESPMIGRGVYIDAGEVSISGNISNIKVDSDMWMGVNGAGVHARNKGVATVETTGKIDSITGSKGTALYTTDGKLIFKGTVEDCTVGNAIYLDSSRDEMAAELSGTVKNNTCTGGDGYCVAISNSQATLTETCIIDSNTSSVATLLCSSGSDAEFYGKITNNTANHGSGSGGVHITNFWASSSSSFDMYSGAVISNNSNTLGTAAVNVSSANATSNCYFTMHGGTISGNIGTNGGAIKAQRHGQVVVDDGEISGNNTKYAVYLNGAEYANTRALFTMNGGKIENNTGYGVYYNAGTGGATNAKVDIAKGIIRGNNNGEGQICVVNGFSKSGTERVSIAKDNVTLSNRDIDLDDLTITLAENYDNVKLGNVSTANEATLNSESSGKGWDEEALATFWVESETAQELTLSGLSDDVDAALPIYALVMPTGEDGGILNETSAAVYAVTGNGDDTYTLNLPATYETGWAVALVQPSEDYGTLTLTPNPETLQEGATSYSIQYTATFKPSDSFENELEQIPDGYTLTFTLDNRLTGEDDTLTKVVTLDELKAGFNYTVTVTTKGGTTLSAGDQLVTSVSLEGSLPVPDASKSVTLVATATVTVTAKPEDPIEPTDPPYIPPVDPDEPADPDDTGVSDLLNTEDHIQYLFGYPDGTFGPENNMTRAEVAQMFYNLLLDQDVEITKTFDDVPANAWYAKAVNTLASLDIISGVGDNKFEPERSITRAEFTAMAMKFAVGGEEGENIFSDVDEDDWFYEAVVNSIQYGWIHGYGDGTFRPNNPITRAEVTAIVNNMLGRAADEDFVDEHAEELTPFSDIEKHWAYYHIVEATNDHDYTKPSSGENWTKLN